MSTSAALPPGASLLSISGRRCTAIPKTDVQFLSSILETFIPGVPISSSAPATTTAPPLALTTSVAAAPPPTSSPIQAAPAAVVPPPDVASQATTSSNIPPAVASPTPSPTPEAPPSTPSTTSILSSPPPSVASAPSTFSTISSSLSSSSSLSLSSSSSASFSTSSSLSSSASAPATSPQFIPPAAVPQQSTTSVVVSSTSTADSVAAKTTSSTPSTPPVVQSDNSPVATSTNDGTLSGTRATASSVLTSIPSSTAAAVQSTTPTAAAAATAATSTGSKTAVGPMVGGILGGFAFIGLVSFILWYLRRRKRRRDSLLTPLEPDPSDMSRSASPNSNRGAVSPIEKFRAQVGSGLMVVGSSWSNLKNRVKGDSKNGVNMNRGNSQFLERIPQHSRNNSVLSGQQNFMTAKERFGEWADRTKENILFKIRVKLPGKEKEPVDPFAASREKTPPNLGDSDFSQLLAMEQNELEIAAERRRQSLARANSQDQADPFADPTNPFNDPGNVVAPPKPSQPPSFGYMPEVRRSRGQSIAQTIGSRYPSTYAPDRDSYGYRDTYMSTESNGRKNKGRSDPFDLEKLSIGKSKPPMPYELPLPPTEPHPSTYSNTPEPRVVSGAPSEVSSMGTYSSKYSSVISDFGEPGPDLGSSYNLAPGPLNTGVHARQDSDAIGGLMRNLSNGSGKSVGKAL